MNADSWRDAPELKEIGRRLEAAENACDPAFMIELMAEDVVILVPHAPPQEGKVACTAFIRDVTDMFRAELDRHITYTSADARALGRVGFDRGAFSFDVTVRATGTTAHVTGKYLWLYSRDRHDAWKLQQAIMSLDDTDEDETGGR